MIKKEISLGYSFSLHYFAKSSQLRRFGFWIKYCIGLIHSGLCRIKMLSVVGYVHGLRETLRVRGDGQCHVDAHEIPMYAYII